MPNFKDLTGMTFHRLNIISKSVNNKRREATWLCKCICGTDCIVTGTSLMNNHTKSCGCLRKEITAELNNIHGFTKNSSYLSWKCMKDRCSNPKNKYYPDYGGRGIKYDTSWEDFLCFYKDMGDKPTNFELDRVNVNLGYLKENCRWTDSSMQSYNTRKKSSNTSGRTGVHCDSKSNKYIARISKNNVKIFIGSFLTFEEACLARAKAEIDLYGINKE